MKTTTRHYLLLLSAVSLYFAASLYIFNGVNEAVKIVIDEYFHIPQGLAYCNGNFSYWDPKITTLPGLYLVSTIIGTFSECNTYNLRFVNLVASCVNLFLFASILKYVYFMGDSQIKIVMQALNLVLLPPLYFFSHIYYTDTLSLTFLLAFSRLCFTNKYKILILFFGLCSVLMRQTNIVWIAMVFGHKALDILIKSSRVFGNSYITDIKLSKNSLLARDIDKSKLKRYYGITDVYYALIYHVRTCFSNFFSFLTIQDYLTMFVHIIILLTFVTFVYINGSIVVGDKSAHQATIHMPQMLYFLMFYGVFGLPYVISKLSSTLQLMLNNKFLVILYSILLTLIVHFNTLVHPYLLADNRHILFYIWNRWYGKYDFAIYATIPIYIFLLFSLYDNLRSHNCISFLLPYTVSCFFALALQKLIEIRYFLIPYVILRLRFGRPSFKVVVFEFLWYLAINAAMFNMFFNKEVYWEDFDYVQRIIW